MQYDEMSSGMTAILFFLHYFPLTHWYTYVGKESKYKLYVFYETVASDIDLLLLVSLLYKVVLIVNPCHKLHVWEKFNQKN